MIEYLVIGLAWLCALNVCIFGVLLLLSYLREPPRWRFHVPDFVPEDWSPRGADAEANSPR